MCSSGGVPLVRFGAAAVLVFLCLCFCGSCREEPSTLPTDLRGLLGGLDVAHATHRVELHASAVTTCGNISYSCPAGTTAKVPTSPCNTTACSPAECCTANPTCGAASVACDINAAPNDPTTVCATLTCTPNDCCAATTTASSGYLRMFFPIPCTGLTQDQWKQQVSAATGIPAADIVITSWSCTTNGLDVTVSTLGSNTALANNALATIAAAATAGKLGPVSLVTFTPFPDPIFDPNNNAGTTTTTTTTTTYPVTSTYPYTTVPGGGSSGNPALFALFTLLLLPILGLAGLLAFLMKPKPAASACSSMMSPVLMPSPTFGPV